MVSDCMIHLKVVNLFTLLFPHFQTIKCCRINEVDMKVIVAGYPKTGTKSLNQALTLLGYKTYDFLEHWWYHGDQWLEILNNGAGPEMFLEMYKDVDVVLDLPAYFFWEENELNCSENVQPKQEL